MPPPICPPPRTAIWLAQEERLRQAIQTEPPRPNLASLVWVDFNRQYQRPEESPPTRPALPRPAEPLPLPMFEHVKKGATP